jgi:hypothetical protein
MQETNLGNKSESSPDIGPPHLERHRLLSSPHLGNKQQQAAKRIMPGAMAKWLRIDKR